MKIKWVIEYRKAEDLYENPTNPRILSKEAYSRLETSLARFGQCEPIVIQPDGLIIGGHQRYNILKEMGVAEIAVYLPSRYLSDEEYRALSIGLNKDLGDWDYDMLATCYEIEELTKMGFTDDELGIGIESPKPQPKFSVSISFGSERDLEMAYEHIERIVKTYAGAKCKKKIKNG